MDKDADFKQWIQNTQEVESYIKEILRDYEALQEMEWFIHSHLSSLKEDALLYQIKEKGDVLQKFSYRAFDYIHHLIQLLSLLETKKWEDELLFSDEMSRKISLKSSKKTTEKRLNNKNEFFRLQRKTI